MGWGQLQPSSPRWQKPRLFWKRCAWSRRCLRRHRARAPPAAARARGQRVLPAPRGARGVQRDEGLPLPPKSPRRALRLPGEGKVKASGAFRCVFRLDLMPCTSRKRRLILPAGIGSHGPGSPSLQVIPLPGNLTDPFHWKPAPAGGEPGPRAASAHPRPSGRSSAGTLNDSHLILLLQSRAEASSGLQTPLRAAHPRDGDLRVSLGAGFAPSRSLGLPLRQRAGSRITRGVQK